MEQLAKELFLLIDKRGEGEFYQYSIECKNKNYEWYRVTYKDDFCFHIWRKAIFDSEYNLIDYKYGYDPITITLTNQYESMPIEEVIKYFK